MSKFWVLFLFFVLIGCGEQEANLSNYQEKISLNVDSTFYYQLTGKLKDEPASVYDIDLFETNESEIARLKSQNKIVICYFSAGTYEPYRPDSDKFPEEVKGKTVEGWSDERWLDIRSDIVRNIMAERIKLAKEKGCDGIEPDNVNGYEFDLNDNNGTGFNLSYDDELDFNRFLSREADKYNLLIGLKNNLGQIKDLLLIFDFALNEECHQYNECDKLTAFINAHKPVFNVEYDSKYLDEDTFSQLCKDSKSKNIHTLVLSKRLDGSLVKSCDYEAK